MPSCIPYNKEARNTGEFKMLFSYLPASLMIRKPGIQENKESFTVKVEFISSFLLKTCPMLRVVYTTVFHETLNFFT